MIFPKSYLLTSLLASVAAAQEWGNFSGQVDSVEYVSDGLYALTSDITVSLAEGWSFVDIVGRNEGQISSKSIVFNSADSKYYGKLAYTNTATSDTQEEVCFPSVPIRISLNQEVDGSTSGRLINGNMYIGCVDKSRIANLPTSTASAVSSESSIPPISLPSPISSVSTATSESSIPPISLPSPISSVTTSSIPPISLPSPISSVTTSSIPPISLPSPISSVTTSSIPPISLPSPISSVTTSSIPPISLPSPISSVSTETGRFSILPISVPSHISVSTGTGRFGILPYTPSSDRSSVSTETGRFTILPISLPSVTPSGSSTTGVHSNKTLVTSHTATGTRPANVTGTGVVVNQNSGVTNAISSVFALGAIVISFALLA
ncbi:hypothetical protein DV495_001392 [Geotrichum candidum]|uniref:Uncharacterized protein n=1 Tax=Geotrichum candidum TaxID=1173061 RepID=A0A0J9XAE9_GEOCN|nr:hypothetical protein DV495_001392 [Geotrichum candidum]KAF7497339.1 hypothetical protein DV113_004622 [Geotrichum candidum]KAI8131697.1 hypothetical protein DUD61_004655 [Geotrichum candidum]CDO54126.1 hypothetical protein, no similarity [Geotrichum candidum]